MRSRHASPSQLRVAALFLFAFALLLWAMAILFPGDHILVNGRVVQKGETALHWWMIVWRVAMGLGGVFSISVAWMCYSLSRERIRALKGRA